MIILINGDAKRIPLADGSVQFALSGNLWYTSSVEEQ